MSSSAPDGALEQFLPVPTATQEETFTRQTSQDELEFHFDPRPMFPLEVLAWIASQNCRLGRQRVM